MFGLFLWAFFMGECELPIYDQSNGGGKILRKADTVNAIF
jgi:hypothetical protein